MNGSEENTFEIGGVQVPADFVVEHKWLTEQLALGGMIGTLANMQRLRAHGFTHVLNLQAEFDDSHLGTEAGVEVLWLEVAEPIPGLPAEIIEKGISFAREALGNQANKLYVHCLAGRNRAPIFAYTILRSTGLSQHQAIHLIRSVEPKARLEEQHLCLVEEFFSSRSNGEFTDKQQIDTK